MSENESRSGGSGPPGRWAESEVDVRRYLGALQRNRLLMFVIVVTITGGVLALSLILPKTYTATSRIVFNPTSNPLQPQDAPSIQRQLATFVSLLSSADVAQAAAAIVSEATPETIQSEATSTVDPQANIISVDASDLDPKVAANIANAVVTTFLAKQRALEQSSAQAEIVSLQNQLDQFRSSPQASGADIQALQDRISSLQVQAAAAGSDLQQAEKAQVPTSPSSPQPVRNTILALFASLFIAVLAALGRDQLSPG